jgi:hypothetical protein
VASSPNGVSQPDVDADDDGNFVVAWTGTVQGSTPQNPNSDIFARRFDSVGNALGGAFTVNANTTGVQDGPRVQTAPSGGAFVVSWNKGYPSLPRFRRFNGQGNAPGGDIAAAEDTGGSPQPGFLELALANDGSFATAYVDLGELSALSFDPAGNVLDSNPADDQTNELLVHPAAGDTGVGTFSRIATDGCGLYVVAYGQGGATQYAAARLLTAPNPCSATTPTTLPISPCGDPNGDRRYTASDALLALRAAVGSGTCPLCLCDLDDSGGVTASDALAILRNAVGAAVGLSCPACP